MAQSKLRSTKYDITKECPICGKVNTWENGKTNSNLVYIKTKRKTVNIYCRDCIDAVWKEYKGGDSNAKTVSN